MKKTFLVKKYMSMALLGAVSTTAILQSSYSAYATQSSPSISISGADNSIILSNVQDNTIGIQVVLPVISGDLSKVGFEIANKSNNGFITNTSNTLIIYLANSSDLRDEDNNISMGKLTNISDIKFASTGTITASNFLFEETIYSDVVISLLNEPSTDTPNVDGEEDNKEEENAPNIDGDEDNKEEENTPNVDGEEDNKEEENAPNVDDEEDNKEEENTPNVDGEEDNKEEENTPNVDGDEDNKEEENAPNVDGEEDNKEEENAPNVDGDEDNKEEENTPNVDGEEDNKEDDGDDDVVEDNKNSSSSSSASSSSSSGSGGSNSSSSLGSASSLNTANTSGLDNIASIKFELKISNSITDDEKDEHYKAIISSYPDLEVDSYWGRHAVAFCIEQGYFNGVYVELEVEGEEIVEKLPFGTEENATRLEIVRVLANMVTDIGESVYNNNFHDIDENSVGTEAIAWALDNEITKGTGDGDNFSPDEPVKRQEMAMFFTRFLTSIDLELPEVFEEVEFIDSSSIWSNPETIESIRILQQAGIIKGHLDGRFDPDGNITRAQFATMLENFVLLLAEENQIK